MKLFRIIIPVWLDDTSSSIRLLPVQCTSDPLLEKCTYYILHIQSVTKLRYVIIHNAVKLKNWSSCAKRK